MVAQDTNQLKNKIISFISLKGPSLPIHISQEIGMSTLFTSAFLSELQAEKRLKTTTMRVGSSPLYFLQGQEYKLENFHEHIKGKEKEALTILKENKFIKDSEIEPPIRVALGAIKDFAIPFEYEGQLWWRYFLNSTDEFSNKKDEKPLEKETEIKLDEKEPLESKLEVSKEKVLRKEKKQAESKTKPIKSDKGKSKKPESDKFFNKIKELLTDRGIEILDIIGVTKNDLTFKIRENNEEKILIAFNKKKISESDILKAYKKAQEFDMKYMILSFGETPKKIANLVEALKSLSDIRKL